MAGRAPKDNRWDSLLSTWKLYNPGKPDLTQEQISQLVTMMSQTPAQSQQAAPSSTQKAALPAPKPKPDVKATVENLCKKYAAVVEGTLTEAVGFPNLHQRECFSNAALQCLAASLKVVELAKQHAAQSTSDAITRLLALAVLTANGGNAEAAKDVVEAIDNRIDTILPSDSGAKEASGQRMANEFAFSCLQRLGADKAVFSVTYTCTDCKGKSGAENESFTTVPLQASKETFDEAWRFFLTREDSVVPKDCTPCQGTRGHTCTLKLINKPNVLALEVGRVSGSSKDRTHFCFHQGVEVPVHAAGTAGGGVGAGALPNTSGAGHYSTHYGLVAAAEHLGSSPGSGHWKAFTRRIGRSVLYDSGETDAGKPMMVEGKDKFLCFDSFSASITPPEETSWPAVSSHEVSFLLYELLPPGHAGFAIDNAVDLCYKGKKHPVFSAAPVAASPLHPRGTAGPPAPPAILTEPINCPLLRSNWSSKTDEEILVHMCRILCAGEPDSLFNANPRMVLSYDPDKRHKTAGVVLAGEPQSGKTNAILLIAWLSHFIYGRFPILCVRGGGGINAREQMRDDIHKFNDDQIKSAHAQAWRQVTKKTTPPPAGELNKWKLYDVVGYGSILDEPGTSGTYEGLFARGKAVVLLRMVTKHNIELVTQRREYRSAKRSARLSDLQQIATLYSKYRGIVVQHEAPVEIIFDEADTLVQSYTKNAGAAETGVFSTAPASFATTGTLDAEDDEDEAEDERLLELDEDAIDEAGKAAVYNYNNNLVSNAQHCIFVTATPTAMFLTTEEGRHLDVALLPVRQQGPAPYYGFNAARVKDKSRLVMFREVERGEVVRGGMPEDKDPGIMEMVRHMVVTPGRAEQRVGLVHCERLVAKHDDIAQWIMSDDLAKTSAIITLQHNGGAQGSKHGCVLRLSEFILKKDSGLCSQFLMPATPSDQRGVVPYSVVDRRLITQKMRGNDVTRPNVDSDIDAEVGAVYFPKKILLVDILDMIQTFKDKYSSLLNRKLTVVIISGNMGNRGTVFKSTDRKLHLTDQYINMTPSTTVQYGVQMCARICGRYADQPFLRLWATQAQYDTMLAMFQIEHAFIEAARRAAEAGVPIREAILKQKWPPLTWAQTDRLKIVKTSVDKHFIAGLVDETHDGSVILKRGEEMKVRISTATGYEHPLYEHEFELNSYLEHRGQGNLDILPDQPSSSEIAGNYQRGDAEPEDRFFPVLDDEGAENTDTGYAGTSATGAGAGAGSGKRSSKARPEPALRAMARPVLDQFDAKIVCSVAAVAKYDVRTLADYLHKQCAMESFRKDQVNDNNIATEVRLQPLPQHVLGAPALADYVHGQPHMAAYTLIPAFGHNAHPHRQRFNHNPMMHDGDPGTGKRLGIWWPCEVDSKPHVVMILRRFTMAQLKQLPEPMAVLWHEIKVIDGENFISVRARRAAESPDDIMGHMYKRLVQAGPAAPSKAKGIGAGAGASATKISSTGKRGREPAEEDSGNEQEKGADSAGRSMRKR